MFAGLGFQEILVILIVALLVFGPKRIPELARNLGRLTREMRRLAWEFRSALELETMKDEDRTSGKKSESDNTSTSQYLSDGYTDLQSDQQQEPLDSEEKIDHDS